MKDGGCITDVPGSKDADGKELDPKKAYRMNGGKLEEIPPGTVIQNPVGKPGLHLVKKDGTVEKLEKGDCVAKFEGGKATVHQVQSNEKGEDVLNSLELFWPIFTKKLHIIGKDSTTPATSGETETANQPKI